MLIIGFARVSSEEQAQGCSLDNQVTRLKKAGCEEIYKEVVSVKCLKSPDYFVISSLNTLLLQLDLCFHSLRQPSVTESG